MNPWWMVPAWGVLGALAGAALSQPTQASLAAPDRGHPLTTAITICSATSVLFGLLAWRVGLRPELLADSALVAVCVPLAAIDLVEKRMPTRLLLPAYPGLVVLFGLTAVVEHNAAAMLRSCAGMVIMVAFYLLIALTVRGALGAADVRLAGLLGLALAWQGWDTLLCGTVLGLGYGALTGGSHRRHNDPPAPSLLAHPDPPRPSSDRGGLYRPAHPPRMIPKVRRAVRVHRLPYRFGSAWHSSR